jgi:hypothetical protein
MGLFSIFNKKVKVEIEKPIYNEFQDVDDSIQIAVTAGYNNEKAVLLTLDTLIKEYEYIKSLGLELNAERIYKKIEYCRTKREPK